MKRLLYHQIIAFTFVICYRAVSAESLTILQTTQSGGQTQLDVNHSYFWGFRYTGTSSYNPIAASFTMKIGSQTAAPAVMKLYEADSNSNTTGAALATVSLDPADFTQSFDPVLFTLFSTPTLLPEYFNVTLESEAADQQSKAYFIKGNLANAVFTFQGDGGPLTDFEYLGAGSGTEGGNDNFSSVPEPSTAGLTMFAACLMPGLARIRRFIVSKS